jgi:hypothetical protein
MKNFPTIVIDNFYNDPDKIRDFALKQDFLEPGNYPGKRTKPLHEINKDLFIEFTSKLFSIYYYENITWNVETSFWKVGTLDNDPLSPKNMGWIHEDGCLVAGVVYLSPGLNKNLGTTIYKQKNEIPKHNMSMNKFYSNGEDDRFDEGIINNNSCYEETTRIHNEYNRLVCFDGKVPHSPSGYYMKDEIRLNQVFFIYEVKSDKQLTPIQRLRNYKV